MKTHVKLINETTIEYAPINLGNMINFNKDEALMIAYGYFPLVKAEMPEYDESYQRVDLTYSRVEDEILEVYTVVDYRTKEEALEEAKENKQAENTTKAKQAVEDGYVVFKEAQFETNVQTCADLTSTMLMMQASGMESYDWLSKDDKVVTLTLEDFASLGQLIATYKNTVWNVKYVGFKQLIEAATTIEEVNAIVIDYEVPEILEMMSNEN